MPKTPRFFKSEIDQKTKDGIEVLENDKILTFWAVFVSELLDGLNNLNNK